MTKRTISKELLKAAVKEKGIARLAVEANCSPALLQKLMSEKYEGNPTISTIDGLCFATGKTLDELFPISKAEEKIA